IASSISIDGKTNHAMEQLEIDWKYSSSLQAADNEIVIRDIVEEIFKSFGLNVTFKAKPLNKVAGSGEHTHVGVSAKLKNGKLINLFSPKDTTNDFMSEIGYGALMGILKNYEVINPFVSDSNDSFNRLVPGFEAPVCIVTSLGKSYELPSRNRSILIGLIRDNATPLGTRFELRSPNPLSNTYLILASMYQAMIDGIKAVGISNLDSKALEKEISKNAGEDGFYLEKDRKYRDEENVFECYTQDEREKLFGKSPATVYENMLNLGKYKDKIEVLKHNGVFTDNIINSFKTGTIDRWMKELKNRIIQENMDIIRSCKKMHTLDDMDALDEVIYNDISNIKYELMKDTLSKKSLFTQIIDAIDNYELEEASKLQVIMKAKMELLQSEYIQYKKNIY
ncbi:MAG: glutamine synthetase, partial [Romboutsia sp.]|nr:glutamine synthetase [Romboutsia sp.]